MKSWFFYLKQGLSRKLPEERIKGKDGSANLKDHLKNLYPFVIRHWRKAIMGIVMIFLMGLLSYPQPLIYRFFIDNVLLAKRFNLLAIIILVLVGIKLLEKAGSVFQRFFFIRFEQEVILDIKNELFNRVLHFPKSFFDKKETGYLMSRLSSGVGGLRWFFSSTIVNILSSTLRFFVGIGLLFYLEWRVAAATLVLLPALALSVGYFSGKIRILGHQSIEHNARVLQRMQESLSSISLIKSFVSEKRELARISKELKDSQEITLERSALDSAANLSVNSVGDLARFIVLVLGGILVIRNQWTLGSLLAFQAYLGYVYGSATFLATTNFGFQNALAALERVAVFFEILPEEHDQGKKIKHLKGEIEFKNVSFSYDGEETVLEELSFRIAPGERVAIAGPSGVGKTTLVSLILAFYRPNCGEILFDRHPLSEYALGSLRERIGYVSQSTRLLSGTIMENLIYGNPKAENKDVIKASQAAGIHDFIINLPADYNTRLGENGINLSEGQRQRLSIARALVKDPDILVLDEPTSSIDSLIEKSIFNALPGILRNKTLIVIAHRLSTIQDSDRILVLKDKRLEAIGTHKTLLQTNKFYQTLVFNQQITPVQ